LIIAWVANEFNKADPIRTQDLIIEQYSDYMHDGKEICEGDIIEVVFPGSMPMIKIWHVIRERGMFMIGGEPLDWRYNVKETLGPRLGRILGNIHEHSALLDCQCYSGNPPNALTE
jgi:hypothetical protein